jgi:hypothetical protein
MDVGKRPCPTERHSSPISIFPVNNILYLRHSVMAKMAHEVVQHGLKTLTIGKKCKMDHPSRGSA